MNKLTGFGMVAVIVIIAPLFHHSDNALLSRDEKQSLRDAVGEAPPQASKKQLVEIPFSIRAQILSDSSLLKCELQPNARKDPYPYQEKIAANCALFDGLNVRVPVRADDWASLVQLNKVLDQSKKPALSDKEVRRIKDEINQIQSRLSSDIWFAIEVSTRPAMNPYGLPDAFVGQTKDQYGRIWTMVGSDRARSDGGYLVETAPNGNRTVKPLSFSEFQKALEGKGAELNDKNKTLLDKVKGLFGEKEPFEK